MSTLLRRWRDWLPLLVIVAAGAALRYYRVGELPPGLYRDEAFYGLDALGVTRGHLAVFFVANNGREGFFMYLLAAGIALLGRTPMALRIVSATVGTLTLPAIYLAGRHLFSHRVGLLSAAVMAVTFWHVALSRVAFRAITLPLLLCITVALGAYVVKRLVTAPSAPSPGERGTGDSNVRPWLPWQAFLAGAAFGLTFYTYTSGQFIVALLIAAAVLIALFSTLRVPAYHWSLNPTARRTARNAVILAISGAVVSLAPFAIWLARHVDLYFRRAEQVSIFSPVINKGDLAGTLLGNVLRAAGMFVVRGDRIWRHNLSLRPVFDGGVAVAFIIGIVACVWWLARRPSRPQDTFRAPASLFLLLWLLIFLVPTVLAEDTPHYLRAVGALPAACIVSAVGLDATWLWLSRRGLLNRLFGPLCRYVNPPAAVAALVLIAATYSTARDYFTDYVNQDMTAYWLEDSNVRLANVVNSFVASNAPDSVWLQDRLANDNPALRFLSPDVEQGRVRIVSTGAPVPSPVTDPAQGTDAAQGRWLLVVDPTHDWAPLYYALPNASAIQVIPGPMAQGDLDPKPHTAFIGIQAQTAPVHATSPLISFEQGIHVQQVGFMSASGSGDDGSEATQLPVKLAPSASGAVTVTVLWGATQPITEDLAVFVHWERNGKMIAQHDGSPAYGYLPMPAWRPGDVVADPHRLTVPGGPQPGDVVTLGIYRRLSNARLRVLGPANGSPVDEDEVRIGVVR